MAMTNGISICEFTVPSGKSPYTLQNNFFTNDADYYLSSSRQSISRTVVKPPSSGGGGATNGIFYESSNTITQSFTATVGKNYLSVGPIVHTTGVVTIANSYWKII